MKRGKNISILKIITGVLEVVLNLIISHNGKRKEKVNKHLKT